MKIQKRLLAFLTAMLLLLPLTGCLVPKDTNKSADPTASSGAVPAPGGSAEQGDTGADEPSDYTAYDGDAIAIELGDIQISAEELAGTFDMFVGNFYSYGLDEETLTQFMRMTEEQLVEYHMPEWKAEALGLSLTAEQEAECAASAQADVDEERDGLILAYSTYDEDVTDVSQLTDEQRTDALEAIAQDIVLYFGEDYTFDDYLATRYEDTLSSYRLSMFDSVLEAHFNEGVAVDKAAVDEWYETTLAEQKALFEDDPDQYISSVNGDDLSDISICLYTPADAARIEIIYIPADESNADRINENKLQMTELEAEYGALKLRGENEERQAEIETEYARIKEETETLEEQQSSSAKTIADKAYADLSGGMSFADAMDLYNDRYDAETGRFERVVFTDGSEPKYPTLGEAAKALALDAYSQPIAADGDYCIIRLVEILPAGAIDRASIEDELNTVVADAVREDAWQAQYDAWVEEAKAAAVYHRETYDMLIEMYLG